MKKCKPFKPPKDIYQFWVAPHCGPGTLDPDEECGFCGLPGKECAAYESEKVALHPDEYHDGGGGDKSGDSCGGCGFWCKGCGRFWAQDSCGESMPGEMHAADGADQQIIGNGVFCRCGKQLARVRKKSV